MKKLLSIFVVLLFALPVLAQGNPENVSRAAGRYIASQYAINPLGVIGPNAPTGTGAQSYTMVKGDYVLPDGRDIVSFFTGQSITFADANIETVTITTATGCAVNAPPNTCVITATVANSHGQGGRIFSGTAGLNEAVQDAATNSGLGPLPNAGGTVLVDAAWVATGGTQAMLVAQPVWPRVVIEDARAQAVQYWNPQGGLTAIATPAVLTAVTALASATPVGTYGTGTYFMCVTYVDIMGQEGPCSATFSQAGLATGSFIFTPPVASTGAVGYKIYISLTSGTYQLAYEVPLTTQPTVIGSYPVSNGVCTLTQVETITPACAVANTTYGQAAGATATVAAITVNTSPIAPNPTVVSTTSVYVPNTGGRTTYTYAPGSHIGLGGAVAESFPFVITTPIGTVIPTVLGSLEFQPGFMNQLGRTIRVCGLATTTASAATIVDVQFQWDAFAQNTAGKGVPIGDLTSTPAIALSTTGHVSFCQDFVTTVVSASATGGSILALNGWIDTCGVTLIACGGGGDTFTGATTGVNLAGEAKLNVIYLHTTATDGAGWILQGLTVQVVN